MAYITREPASAERQLAYIANTAREDLVFSASRNLPDFSGGNSYLFFEAAEKYERVNGVAFEEFKITLPVEHSLEQNQALAEDLIDVIAGDRLPCTYAFHNPKTLDGTCDQPHLHLLISARQTDGIERTVEQHFRRYNAAHPERGGAQKAKEMNVYHATKLHRLIISDMLNVHLEYNGKIARVHPDSLEKRGIAREPEPKLLPSDSATYRKDGRVSKTMEQVLSIRTARADTFPAERKNARLYWEERKKFLGITEAMSREAKVAHILHRRHGTVERVPERYRPLVEHKRSRSRQHRHVEQSLPRTRSGDTRSVRQRLTQLAAKFEGDEPRGHGHLRVRLHEDERDPGFRQEGLGW